MARRRSPDEIRWNKEAWRLRAELDTLGAVLGQIAEERRKLEGYLARAARDHERATGARKRTLALALKGKKAQVKKDRARFTREEKRALLATKAAKKQLNRARRNIRIAREIRQAAEEPPQATRPPEGWAQVPEGRPFAAPALAARRREDLRDLMDAVMEHVSGRTITHVYGDAEVVAFGYVPVPERGDDVILDLQDGFYQEVGDTNAPRVKIYPELYFQGEAEFVSEADFVDALAATDDGKRSSSLDRSRLGPDGRHYKIANTYWFRGNHVTMLDTLQNVISNVETATDYELSRVIVRALWRTDGSRPARHSGSHHGGGK